jgi:hypothetical protein
VKTPLKLGRFYFKGLKMKKLWLILKGLWQRLITALLRPTALGILFALLSIFIYFKFHNKIDVFFDKSLDLEASHPSGYELLGILIAAITLLVYTATLLTISYQVRTDHDRRKKQATIEHLDKVRTIYRETKHYFDEKIVRDGGTRINPVNLTAKEKQDLRNMLSVLEHLSVGVHARVFDFQLIRLMSKSILIDIYKISEDFINERRQESPTYFSEYQRLVHDLENNGDDGIIENLCSMIDNAVITFGRWIKSICQPKGKQPNRPQSYNELP